MKYILIAIVVIAVILGLSKWKKKSGNTCCKTSDGTKTKAKGDLASQILDLPTTKGNTPVKSTDISRKAETTKTTKTTPKGKGRNYKNEK